MPNTALSLVVTKEMLNNLQKADDKIKKLAQTSDAASKKIIASFKSINTQGIGAFINRLDEAQRKLSQLGSTRLNLAGANNIQAMTDAINRLSQASRTNITINGIDTVGNQATKAMDAINRLIVTLGQLQNTGGMQSFNQVNVIGRETLKEMNKEAKRMERTLDSLDKSIAKYGISATELANKLAQARKAQEQFNENAKRQAQSDVNGLLGMRGQQRTLNELRNYANELKRTMNNLDPQSKEWQQLNKVLDETNKKINDIQGAMKGVKGKTNNLMHSLNRFRQLVGVAFSISRITNFANKLMNVRKEFEMQQRSLQALLQNKDEADKLWQKTIDLAVKSPFRVKELVTYTKQLAAYRIESEKLYETNKMLADISAGLGVDMQRLILAFGQVKAANYLRGTELRQFSEAGVNILGELSKYFTELEGRAISVGDVFERVSKRMVSFSDVEEIFKRLTSAGGTFYRMQEIQSETLKGLISNLGDSIDLMLNDIGKEHDSTLKGAVGSVRNLVENWREIAFVLEKVAYSMTIAKLSSLALAKGLETSGDKALWFSKYFSSLNGVTLQQATQIKATGQGWTKFLNILKASGVRTLATIQGAIYGVGAALKSMIPVAIIALIIEIWRRLTKASRAAKELKKNLNSIFNEDTTNLYKQIDAYKDLVTRLEQANKGSKERNDIIGKLNSQYGEYLNFIVDEQTSIQNLSAAYEDVVKRMKEKQALATFEKGMDAIAKSYSDSLQDAKDEFYDLFKGQSIVNTKSSFSGIVPTKEEVDDIYAIVQQRVRELNADQIDNLSEQSKLIQEIIKDYYGEDFSLSRDYGKSIELLDILVDKKEKERELQKDINAQYGETLTSREANLALEKLQNEYAEKRRNIEKSGVSKFDINKQLNELAKLEKLDIIDLKVRFNIITPESGAIEKDKIINWATNITKSVNETIQKELGNIFSEEDLAKVLINEDIQKSQSISEYVKGISSAWEQQNEIIAEQISLKSEGHTINEQLLKDAFRMEELYRKVAKLLGIELKYEERINEETRKSINDKLPLEYQISLEESLKSQASLLEEANKKKEDAIKLQAMYNASQEKGISISEEQLKKVEEEVKYWTLRWELLGGTKKQGGSDRSNSLYDERIKVIDDMNKKYKELNKTLSKSESLQGAFDAYIDAFASAFEGISWVPKNVKSMTPQEFASQVLNFPNENDLVRFLDELAKEPMKAFEKIKVELAKGEYVYDMKVRAKIEDDKALLDQIEEMFSGYEISLELQKLNIPNDLAKQLFDVDAITLPELKLQVESLKSQFEGKDMLDEWDKLMKRINEMEAKAQQERLKTYSQYLVKAQSERVKIKLEELRKIAEVEKESAFTDTQRQEILESLRNETQKNLDKLTWDEFKDSDLYLKVFEDLEYVSDVALTSVKDKLDLMRSSLNNLSVEDLRIITKEMQKIDEELIQRSPFKALTSNLKDYILFLKERNEIEQKWIDSQSKEDALKAQTDDSQIRIAQLQQEYETSVKTKGVLSEESIAIKRKLDFEKQILDNNLKQLVAQGKITQEYADQLREGEKNKKGVVEGLKGAMNDINDGYNAFNGLMDTIQSMFGEFGEGFQSFLDGVSGVVDGLGTIEGGLSQILDGKIFSGIINTITGVFKSIGAIFGIGLGDIRKQREIEREIVLVEDLQKQYEKLNKTINKAYSISSLEINQKAMSKNIDTQIRSYEKMIKLEDDKKNTDKEKIKEWEDTIEELREKRKELNDEILSGLGGVIEEEYRSATRAFVDAWTSAFQETGNGLEGLQQHFADFFNNILSEQATLHIAQNMLAPFYRQVESALNDSRLSSSEAKALKDKFTEIAPQINDFLSTFFENIGGLVDGSKYELSGLQRGIQGITEDQADVIASYLNSMRFFVADSNTKLSLLVDSFTNPESANPMLSELRSQSEMLRAIRDMFSSVIGRGSSTHTGAFLKVAL